MSANSVLKAFGIAATLGLVVGASQPARAAIIGVSGNAAIGNGVGANLDDGQTQLDDVIGFTEQQNVAIDSLNVDYLISGNDIGQQFGGANNPAANPLILGSGTYNSSLLHFDAVGASGQVSDATFTFSGDIVAIIANSTFLEQSDAFFGVASSYSNRISRRTENGDLFAITASNTLRVDRFRVGGGLIDELRVITATSTPAAAAPEPLTVIGSVVALGLGATVRRRQAS